MFKSAIVASLLLASQAFALYKEGDECFISRYSSGNNINYSICDDGNMLLICVKNATSSRGGSWRKAQSCGYCCNKRLSGPYCASSRAECESENGFGVP